MRHDSKVESIHQVLRQIPLLPPMTFKIQKEIHEDDARSVCQEEVERTIA